MPRSQQVSPPDTAVERIPHRLHLRVARRSLRGAAPLLYWGPLFLGLGMVIYHLTEGLPWSDSFLNAAMLLGGMGPVAPIRTELGKYLIGLYAMLAGVIFLVTASVMLSPVIQGELRQHHEAHRSRRTEQR